jgi:hypothetical protein
MKNPFGWKGWAVYIFLVGNTLFSAAGNPQTYGLSLPFIFGVLLGGFLVVKAGKSLLQGADDADADEKPDPSAE